MSKKSSNKFVLFAPDGDGAKDIEREVSKQLGPVMVVESAKEAFDHIFKGGVSCFILSVEKFESKNVDTIVKLRALNMDLAVMVIAKNIDEEAFKKCGNMKRVILLERPLKEAKIVAQFCQKIIGGQEVYNRKHQRFRASQKVIIEDSVTGEKIQGHLHNISKGGAYIEFDSQKVEFKSGDLVKLVIYLDQLSKSHSINAKIAWSSLYGIETGKPAAGLQFVDQDDVYRYFLEKMRMS